MKEALKELYTKNMDYNTFIEKLRRLVLNEMEDMVEHRYKVNCVISNNLKKDCLAYTKSFTEIGLSEELVKRIYNKDKLSFFVILHELEKIYQNYLINVCLLDPNTIKILKEKLVLEIDGEENTEEDYCSYYSNSCYTSTSEILAARYAYMDIIDIFDDIGISLSEKEKEYIVLQLELNRKLYEMTDGNTKNCVFVNGYDIDFDDYFEQVIYEHPEWIKDCPQLSFEFYVTEDGKVLKRDNIELMNLYRESEYEEEKKYIEYLIAHNKKNKVKICS